MLEILGRGSHGTVCRAVDRRSSEPVAVKVLNDGAARDPGQVERLAREQQALLALSGTSAVQVLDLCTTNQGVACLVMELLHGEDLEQHLEAREAADRHLEKERLSEILDPVVDTLERAHVAGIIHRDLKPANVFLLSEPSGGGVRLLDFGLARLASAKPMTVMGMVMGTPSYIAPEIWKGASKEIDGRADVYSLAVIMYRALTGELPFDGEDVLEICTLAVKAERPRLRALRPDLPEPVDAWMAKAPGHRPRGSLSVRAGVVGRVAHRVRDPATEPASGAGEGGPAAGAGVGVAECFERVSEAAGRGAWR